MKHLPRDRCKPGLAPAGDSLSLASPRESKQREGDPMVRGVFGVRAQIRRADGSPVGVRCNAPQRNGCLTPITYPAVLAENGVELELAALKQSLALIRFWLRSSAQPDGGGEQKQMRVRGDLTREARQVRHGTVMCARGSRTRGQMKSPSIAQRGEGGARGGSGELHLLTPANRGRSVMPISTHPHHRPSFGDFLLATQKKVTCRRATPGQLSEQAAALPSKLRSLKSPVFQTPQNKVPPAQWIRAQAAIYFVACRSSQP